MKKISLILLTLLCVTVVYAQKNKKEKKSKSKVEVVAPKSLPEITSYALGVNIVDGLKQNSEQLGITVDWEWVVRGLREAADGKSQFDSAKMSEAFAKLDSLVKENRDIKARKQKEFLEENKKKAGVITTPSGLQYEVITLGTGDKPTLESNVEVNYEGKTIDGKVFDSSYERGTTTSFKLSNVIPGWQEGLQLMPVGSKFRFYIPSELAYGERGAGNDIESNATLIFEVELLNIVPDTELVSPNNSK